MQVSIIIPSNKEPHLATTCRRIRETQGDHDVEIIAVFDGKDAKTEPVHEWAYEIEFEQQQGIHNCRDTGLEHASHDCVIILDAHMQFKDGWIDKMTERFYPGTSRISCASCVGICPTTYEFSQECQHCVEAADKLEALGAKRPRPRPTLYGANVKLMDESSKENRTEYRVFPSSWRNTGPGEVQSVLGACYMLSRQHYMDVLRRPWSQMKQWGTSEQSLSIINWLWGGDCECVDVEVGHLFRTAVQLPYTEKSAAYAIKYISGIWFNRYWLSSIVPSKSGINARLIEHLDRNSLRSGVKKQLAEWMPVIAMSDFAAHMQNAPRKIEDYIDHWGI